MLIVDDEKLVRSALHVFLQAAEDIEICGEAVSGEEAIARVADTHPNVVLMDVQMPGMGGIEATKHLAQAHPDVSVVALTTFSTERTVMPMLRAGASGFLVKDIEPDAIIDAIRRAHLGTYVMSPQVTHDLIAAVRDEEPKAPSLPLSDEQQLTEREVEVVEQLARGMSNAEIAAALFLSETTVKAHLGHIMTKWGKRDRIQVLIYAVRARLVSLG